MAFAIISEIIPSDTVDLPLPAESLWVNTRGDVRVLTTGDNDITIGNVAAGTIVPVQAKRVFVTGTTAAGIFSMR